MVEEKKVDKPKCADCTKKDKQIEQLNNIVKNVSQFMEDVGFNIQSLGKQAKVGQSQANGELPQTPQPAGTA